LNLKDKSILVVGDIMLDKYIIGTVDRISNEAPVPIVHVKDEYSELGGCGNTVKNIRELGANVSCLASIGNDKYGKEIKNHLDKIGITSMLVIESKNTTVKERIIADERKIQMIRIDRETIKPVNPDSNIGALKKDNFGYDLIVISDYAKGMITKKLMEYLHKYKTRIIVDPKPKNFNLYKNVFMITPNKKEWEEIINLTFIKFPNSMDYTLLTEGSDGMTLIDNKDKTYTKIESDEVPVYSVLGAGDTVISIMAVCLAMDWNPIDAAYIANRCAAYVVTQSTTAVVPKDLFFKIVKDYRKGIV